MNTGRGEGEKKDKNIVGNGTIFLLNCGSSL